MKKQLLISAMLISGAFAAWAAEPAHLTSSPYEGAEIQAGGTYYLYNVETGTWLDGNDQIPNQWSVSYTHLDVYKRQVSPEVTPWPPASPR